MTITYPDNIVLLPVRLEDAPALAQLRDKAASGELDLSTVCGNTPIEIAISIPGQGAWNESMVARVKDNLRYPLVKQLLDTCASRPDEWVTKAEIDTHSENGPLQLRNELGAFSKLVKKLFGGEIRWPVEWVKEAGGYRYRMPAAMAQVWEAHPYGG